MLGVLPNREIEPMLRLDPIGNLQAIFACQKDLWRLSVVWVDDKKDMVTGTMVESPPDRPSICSIFAQDEVSLQGLFTQLPKLRHFILPKWAVPIAQKRFPTADFSCDLVNVCTKFDLCPKPLKHKAIRLTDDLVDRLVKDSRILEQIAPEKNAIKASTSGSISPIPVYGSLEDGQVVSIAKCQWPTDFAVSIVGVYTLPEYRSRGHATATVFSATQTILDEGKVAVYSCQDDNIPSLNVCQKVGYWFYKSIGFMTISEEELENG